MEKKEYLIFEKFEKRNMLIRIYIYVIKNTLVIIKIIEEVLKRKNENEQKSTFQGLNIKKETKKGAFIQKHK